MDDHLKKNGQCKVTEGNCFHSKPKSVIGHVQDSEGELFFCVTFKPNKERYYRPQWLWAPLAELYCQKQTLEYTLKLLSCR